MSLKFDFYSYNDQMLHKIIHNQVQLQSKSMLEVMRMYEALVSLSYLEVEFLEKIFTQSVLE